MLWWQVQSAFGRYGTYYNLHSQTKCLVVVVADSFFHIHFVLVVDPIIGISALRSKKKEIVRRGIHSPKKKQNKWKNWGKQHWEDSKRVNLSPCALWRLHTWSRGQTRMLCSKLTHNYTYPQSAWAKKNKQKQIMIMWIAFCGAWSGAGWQRPRPVKVLNCFSAYQPRSIDSIAFLPPHAEHARYSEFTRF